MNENEYVSRCVFDFIHTFSVFFIVSIVHVPVRQETRGLPDR